MFVSLIFDKNDYMLVKNPQQKWKNNKKVLIHVEKKS